MTPPAFSSAFVNGSKMTVNFDGLLGEKEVPAGSAFTVRRTRAGTTTTVGLVEPSPVAVFRTTVTLWLAEAVLSTDTVTVAYTAPGTGAKLRDADRDELPVPSFTAQSARNLTTAIGTREAFSSATVNGSTLTVSLNTLMSEAAADTPLGNRFTVTATPPGGTARTIPGSGGNVAISGTDVTVTLAEAVDRSEGVTVSYAKPSSNTNALRYSSGPVYIASFSDEPVTNNSPVTPPPTFESASYSYESGGITVNFDGPFTGCANKAPGASGRTAPRVGPWRSAARAGP